MATPVPTSWPAGVVGITVSGTPRYLPAGTEWWVVTDLWGGQNGMTPAEYFQKLNEGYWDIPEGAYGLPDPADIPVWQPPTDPAEGQYWPPETPPDTPSGYGPGGTAPGTPASARAYAAQMLYQAMQGMPYASAPFLSALQGGQLPAPNTFTPQTIRMLGEDPFLSDTFFSLIEASGLYPTSFLAEVNRFLPRGAGTAVAPSFV